jgi:hypothetical protein
MSEKIQKIYNAYDSAWDCLKEGDEQGAIPLAIIATGTGLAMIYEELCKVSEKPNEKYKEALRRIIKECEKAYEKENDFGAGSMKFFNMIEAIAGSALGSTED